MKRFAPILWMALAIGAIAYWSNSDSHHSQASTATTEDASDDDSSDDPGSFHGYPCTVDCSGHQAGYDWAEQHDIDDEDSCGGNSQSFIEGCKSFVQEQHGASGDEPSHDESDEDN